MRLLSAALAALLFALPAAACSVCGPGLLGKSTLREQFAQSKAVVVGTLKNPKPDAKGTGGTTEFHFRTTLKTAGSVEKVPGLVIPQYFPVVGNTSPDYLFFFDEVNGKAVVSGGVPAAAAVVDYLTAAAKLDDRDPSARLAFAFEHLDSADPTTAADAFLEFAKAPDASIVKARAALDPAKLIRLLADPQTPDERVGVFAALLGVCGQAKHARAFSDLLKEPLSERASGNLGGVLAGFVLLDPKGGWKATRAVLVDGERPFAHRLNALSAVRFLQTARPTDTKADILGVYGGLLTDSDLADLVVEDLRRWGWWDKTADVLAAWGKPAGEVREVRKAIVRYAVSCPDEAAKTFLAAVRKTDAKLVEREEERVKQK